MHDCPGCGRPVPLVAGLLLCSHVCRPRIYRGDDVDGSDLVLPDVWFRAGADGAYVPSTPLSRMHAHFHLLDPDLEL